MRMVYLHRMVGVVSSRGIAWFNSRGIARFIGSATKTLSSAIHAFISNTTVNAVWSCTTMHFAFLCYSRIKYSVDNQIYNRAMPRNTNSLCTALHVS